MGSKELFQQKTHYAHQVAGVTPDATQPASKPRTVDQPDPSHLGGCVAPQDPTPEMTLTQIVDEMNKIENGELGYNSNELNIEILARSVRSLASYLQRP